MTITGKVYCLFEQSGTFKNEFIKLGIPAEDYDIQNNFGQTDHIVDLFEHIEALWQMFCTLCDKLDAIAMGVHAILFGKVEEVVIKTKADDEPKAEAEPEQK